MAAQMRSVFIVLSVGLDASITSLVEGSSDGQYIQWPGRTPKDLFEWYGDIFPTQNRNAASHKWASFLLERSQNFDEATFKTLMGSFCAVSGSIVYASDFRRYGLVLDQVADNSTCGAGKKQRFGYMYYCCWPCVCDTQDFIQVDSKTVRLTEGGQVVDRQFWFNVMANPCEHEEKLAEKFVQPFDQLETSLLESAQEVRCEPDASGRSTAGKKLQGATLSDHGHPIISMFFDSEEVSAGASGDRYTCTAANSDNPGRMTPANAAFSTGTFQSECEYKTQCSDRASTGYDSGMGEIFRKVAGMSVFKQPPCVV